MDIPEIIRNMTLEEKAGLLCGYSQMGTMPLERLGVPPLYFSDGPYGVRAQKPGGDSLSGICESYPATCFPTAAACANSWDTELLRLMGEAIGEECLNYGVHVLLGPAVNIKRNPLAGRNFEYFSEDPLLTGELASSFVKGVQKKGVGVSVKHFAANNAENFRFNGDSVVDLRALTEIYLKPFERIVRKARPLSVMCAYNRLNGEFCSQNKWLLNDVLRDRWGFDGVVMSDWGAVKDRIKGVCAGLDLEMPGMVKQNIRKITDGVNQKTLSPEAVDNAVKNMLTLIERVYRSDKAACDFEAHAKLAARMAEESAVLLKNEAGTLPLKKDGKYLIIGDLFRYMRYQGSGSSMINPYMLITPENEFDLQKTDYEFVRGYRESETAVEKEYLCEALDKAEKADNIIVFAGLTDYVESEGFDRENMKLADNQTALLCALSKLDKKMTLVLFGGGCAELPFADGFCAILNMYLPGECGGKAVYRILFGEANPSGKLAQTWPMCKEDVPCMESFSKNPVECYRESVFVGYRYYLSAGKKELFPFGFGLSYTDFEYSGLSVTVSDSDNCRGEGQCSCDALSDAGKNNVKIYRACFTITNTGSFDGAEIAELYVSAPQSQVFKPAKELRGFCKVFLRAGESRRAEIVFCGEELCYFNPKLQKWVAEPGKYEIQIGASSTDIRLIAEIEIEGENVPPPYDSEVLKHYADASNAAAVPDFIFERLICRKIPGYVKGMRPYTYETPIGEFDTFFGRILKKFMSGAGMKQYKKACRMPDGPQKERRKKAGIFLARMITANSLRSLCYSSGGIMPYSVSRGLLEIANGHVLRGLAAMLKQ